MTNEEESENCKNLGKNKDADTTDTGLLLPNEKSTQSTFVDMKLICENCKQVNKYKLFLIYKEKHYFIFRLNSIFYSIFSE